MSMHVNLMCIFSVLVVARLEIHVVKYMLNHAVAVETIEKRYTCPEDVEF